MKQTIEETIKYRKELVLKGWCDNKDVQHFVPCCPQKAKEYIEKIRKDSKLSEHEEANKKIVSTERLIKFMGIKVKL